MEKRRINVTFSAVCLGLAAMAYADDAGLETFAEDSRVKFASCQKCRKRIRVADDYKSVFVNLSRLDGADKTAVARRAARLLDQATITPSDDERRPLMGWSSWNTMAFNVTESIVLSVAEAMHTNGLQAAGYNYVNIDDGFFAGHGPDGRLRIHPERFPNGLKGSVDGIHALGLKAGIYSEAGANTCGSMWGGDHWGVGSGLYGHDKEECELFFNELGFDFIKVDYCGAEAQKLDERKRYTEIAEAIRATGKKVRFNICRWAFPGVWAAEIAESWRTTGDIRASWKSIRDIIAKNLYLSAYARLGHYNDMDMLEVGQLAGVIKTEKLHKGDIGITPDEEISHFGMWCIMSSPLLLGSDVRFIPASTLKLVTNPYLLGMNQNDLGLQAYVASKQGEAYVLVKDAGEPFGRSRYVALYNPSDRELDVEVDAAALDLAGRIEAFDLVEAADYGPFDGKTTVTLRPHCSKFYRLDAERRLDRTVYEAETAFLPKFDDIKRRGAYVGRQEGASGEAVVKYLGNAPGNDLFWKNVNVSQAGDYRLVFDYWAYGERAFSVQVDDAAPVEIVTNGNGRKSSEITIRLGKGIHQVRLFNDRAYAPDIDLMRLDRK